MIANVVFMLGGYVVYFWLGRTLEPASYGVYALVISIISLLNLLLNSGIPTAVSKFASENEEEALAIRNKALKLQISFSIIITFLYILLAPVIAWTLNDPELVTLLRTSAIVIPIYAIYSVMVSYYNGLHRFSKQSFVMIFYSIAKMFLVIGLVYVWHLKGAILGFSLSPLVALLFVLDFKKSEKTYDSKKLIRFAIPIIILSVSLTLIGTLDLLMVKSILKDNALTGFYSAAERISKVPYFLLGALGVVLLPAISRSIQTDTKQNTKNLINRSLKILIMILAPLTLLISFSAQKIVTILYSGKYAQAGLPLSILIFGAGFLTVFVILSSIINASNRPKIVMYITLVGLLISFASNYILIKRFGLVGGAISTTLATFIMVVIAAIYTYRLHKRLVSLLSVLKIGIVSVIIAIPVIFIQNKLLLLFSYPFLLLLYLIIMIGTGELKRADLKEVLPKQITNVLRLE